MSTTAGPHMIRPATVTAEQRSQRVFARRTLGRTVLPSESGTTLLTEMCMDICNTYNIDTHMTPFTLLCHSGCLFSELFHVHVCIPVLLCIFMSNKTSAFLPSSCFGVTSLDRHYSFV